MLNLENLQSGETKAIFMLDINILQDVPSTQTSPLLTILVTVIPEQAAINPSNTVTIAPSSTIISSLLSSLYLALKQMTPLPTSTTTEATTSTILKNVDHSSALSSAIRSELPTVVKGYLGTSLDDALYKVVKRTHEEFNKEFFDLNSYKDVIDESVQTHVMIEVQKQLPTIVYDFVTPVIQSTVYETLEKNPGIIAQTSSQPQTSYEIPTNLKTTLSWAVYPIDGSFTGVIMVLLLNPSAIQLYLFTAYGELYLLVVHLCLSPTLRIDTFIELSRAPASQRGRYAKGSSGYGILIINLRGILVKSRHGYAVSSLLDTAYWMLGTVFFKYHRLSSKLRAFELNLHQLKKIPMDKMTQSKSYQIDDIQKRLYDALALLKGKSPATSSKSVKSAKEHVEEPIFVQGSNDDDKAIYDVFDNTEVPINQEEDLGKSEEQPTAEAVPKND
ncbi:hypothetical protein Tco_1131592 [Tanacetum coccineum]